MAEWLKIIGLGVIGAIACGIALDNVASRVCVEYFTIGHAPIFGTQDPTLLALGRGVLASWWVGLGLGIDLAPACRVGRRPRLSANDPIRPLGVLLDSMAALSLPNGLGAHFAANRGWNWLAGNPAGRVPSEKPAASPAVRASPRRDRLTKAATSPEPLLD